MKKVTYVAAALVLAGFTFGEASAQTTTPVQQEQATPQQEAKKEKVTQAQLPAPVATTLANEVYKDWTVGDIFRVTPAAGAADAKVVYEVSMTNAQGQTGLVLLDEAGRDASEKE